jgi:hypothetical protein
VNRDKIITELYQSKEIREIAQSIVKGSGCLNWEDLLHTCIVKMFELPEAKFQQLVIRDELSYYLYGIMRFQVINPYMTFNKANRFTGTEIIDDITPTEDQTEHSGFTFDEFKSYCYSEAEKNSSEDVKLAAKVTYGYLIYEPKDEKKSYRSFQKATDIHYSSICQYVKKMRELYEKNQTGI